MSEFIEGNLERLNMDDAPSVSNGNDIALPPPVEISVPRPIISSVPSSSSSAPPTPRGKKKVTFAANTIVKEEETIASSVTSHQYVRTIGHTQYKVELIFRGIHWTIVKRYRDFEAFHRKLVHGLPDEELSVVPELPKKRWFEKQRWINRFDDTYSRNRRFALQDYLRMVIRTFPFRQNQALFVEFLEIPPEALDQDDRNVYDDYTAQRDREREEAALMTHYKGNLSPRDEKEAAPEEEVDDGDQQSSDEDQHLRGSWREMEGLTDEGDEDGANVTDTASEASPRKQIKLSSEADSDDEEDSN